MQSITLGWFLASLSFSLWLTACSAPPDIVCRDGFGTPMLVFTLYFGRSVPGGGEVTDAEFAAFTEQVLATDLPNGHTTQDATGAWLSPQTGRSVRERTKVLTVALPDTPESATAIQRVRAAYQARFRQLLVGMTMHPVCGSF
jgi:hypothetical protein